MHSFRVAILTALKDLRIWVIVIPSLMFCGLAMSFLGPRVAATLTLAIGLIASHLLNHIEKLPTPKPDLSGLYTNFIVPMLAGILIVNGAAIFARLWLMFWRWSHTSKETLSCGTLLTGAALDWIGCVVAGALLATLVHRRITSSAMIGVTSYLCLEFTGTFNPDSSREAVSLLATSCKWLLEEQPDAVDYDSFQFGLAFGLVSRAILVFFVTRVVSYWRAKQLHTTESAI